MSAITAARAAELLAARTQTAHECAVLMMMEHPARNSSQRYLVCDALARRFSAPGGPLDALCAAYDAALADLHARLAQCEGERDEARASVSALLLIVGQARAYFAAYEAKHKHGQTALSQRDEAWIERNEDLDDDVRQCLAGIRVAVRDERSKCEEAMR